MMLIPAGRLLLIFCAATQHWNAAQQQKFSETEMKCYGDHQIIINVPKAIQSTHYNQCLVLGDIQLDKSGFGFGECIRDVLYTISYRVLSTCNLSFIHYILYLCYSVTSVDYEFVLQERIGELTNRGLKVFLVCWLETLVLKLAFTKHWYKAYLMCRSKMTVQIHLKPKLNFSVERSLEPNIRF